jgi:hypothetical protein
MMNSPIWAKLHFTKHLRLAFGKAELNTTLSSRWCPIGLPPAPQPADLRKAPIANGSALAAWKDITPLARNEFICWVEDAKQEVTRKHRIRRTQEELEEGLRRPCLWPGCKHRETAGR